MKQDDTRASGVSERGQYAVTGGEIAVGVHGLRQTWVARPRSRPQAALDRIAVAPQDHRIDEPVAAAVGEFCFGEALAQPAVR